MERINGYLCIDNCEKKLANVKLGRYWVYINGEEYYFKPCILHRRYKELVGYYAAKILGIEACFYDLAVLNGQYGCISKSLRGSGVKLILGAKILCEYFSSSCAELLKIGLNENDALKIKRGILLGSSCVDAVLINNLEIIWKALEYRYGDEININELMDQFIMMYIYTVVVADGDRHCLNWMVIEDSSGVRLAPLFDNEYILSPFFNTNNYSVNFKDFRIGFYDSLREFFKIYNSEYCELFIKLFERLRNNFDSIFESIKQQTGVEFPIEEKIMLLNKFNSHCDKINEVIFEYKKKRLKRELSISN